MSERSEPREPCLGDDEIVELLDGDASAERKARIEHHAAGCTACRNVLSALARDEVELSRMRTAAGKAPARHDAQVMAWLARQRQIAAQIARGRGKRLALVLAGGLAVAALAVAILLWALAPPRPPSTEELYGGEHVCRGEALGTWSVARRQAITRGLAPLVGDTQAREVIQRGDDYARAWAAMKTEACRQDRVYHLAPAQLFALRSACLDEHRREFDALGEILMRPTPDTAAGAAHAMASLRSLAPCADLALLARVEPLPRSARAGYARDVAPRLARARALLDLDRVQLARDELAAVAEAAHATPGSVTPEAAELIARVAARANTPDALELLATARASAITARDDEVLAWALVDAMAIDSSARAAAAAYAAVDRLGYGGADLRAALGVH